MAKKPITTEDVKKLTSEELEQLQKLNYTIQNIVTNLGNLDIAKYDLLNELASVRMSMNEFTDTLQKKYGDVTVSVADGIITEQEPAQTPEMQVVKP